MLAAARNETVPCKQSFEEAWSAIPAYQEYMKHDVMARSSYTIDDHIIEFLRNRLISIQTMTIDGFTVVFEYVYATGKYIMRVCEQAVDAVIGAVDKE